MRDGVSLLSIREWTERARIETDHIEISIRKSDGTAFGRIRGVSAPNVIKIYRMERANGNC